MASCSPHFCHFTVRRTFFAFATAHTTSPPQPTHLTFSSATHPLAHMHTQTHPRSTGSFPTTAAGRHVGTCPSLVQAAKASAWAVADHKSRSRGGKGGGGGGSGGTLEVSMLGKVALSSWQVPPATPIIRIRPFPPLFVRRPGSCGLQKTRLMYLHGMAWHGMAWAWPSPDAPSLPAHSLLRCSYLIPT